LLARPPLPVELTSSGVVAIARAPSTRHMADAVETLVAAGIRCIELTLTTPGALACIASLVASLGAEACIGAGTVLSADEANACIDAGARFLVAPSAVPDVVTAAAAVGIPCLPGALTPSEIVGAWNGGAAAVKLFPASLGGPEYLRAVRAPLPDVAIVPTGGVAISDVAGFISAGATAVGLGGPLFANSLVDGDCGALRERAAQAVEAIGLARASRSA
jgi:2-dehydro-3-deoxyphosphogluconate aldolase / (4S)-4-hydroxy-2-oxoglutarate aldolase